MRRKEAARTNLERESTRHFLDLLTAREELIWEEMQALYWQLPDQDTGIGVWRGLKTQMNNSQSMCCSNIDLPLVEGNGVCLIPTIQLRWHLNRFDRQRRESEEQKPFIGAVLIYGPLAHGLEENDFCGDSVLLEGVRLTQKGGFYVTMLGSYWEEVAIPLGISWEGIFTDSEK